jgi:translation initiation factor 3 subunit I
MFNPIGSKATVCAFTLTPNVIITGHESGKVALFNVKTGEEVDNNERAHGDVVTDMQMSNDRTYCITASKDKSARVRPRMLLDIRDYDSVTDTRHKKSHGYQNIYYRDSAK